MYTADKHKYAISGNSKVEIPQMKENRHQWDLPN